MSDIKKFEDTIKGNADEIYDFKDKIAPNGDFEKVQGINALILSLRTLLLTPLESYPFDPTFGSLLYRKVWELHVPETRDAIEYEVHDRVMAFDDRIIIEYVEVVYFSNLKGYRISLQISYEGKSAETDLEFDQQHGIGLE